MRGGLFMGWKAAAVGAAFAGDLGHVVDICLGESAAVIDFGKFCRNLGKTMVLQPADVVAGLCGLAFGVGAGMTFHGGFCGPELTGGIFGENGWKIDAVDFQKFIEHLMVVLFPHWVAIRGKN